MFIISIFICTPIFYDLIFIIFAIDSCFCVIIECKPTDKAKYAGEGLAPKGSKFPPVVTADKGLLPGSKRGSEYVACSPDLICG